MTDRARLRLQVFGGVLSIALAVAGAAALADRVRAVDLVTVFAGGFGAGATLVGLVHTARAARAAARRAPEFAPPSPAAAAPAANAAPDPDAGASPT